MSKLPLGYIVQHSIIIYDVTHIIKGIPWLMAYDGTEATIWEQCTDSGSISIDAALTVMSNEREGIDKDAICAYACNRLWRSTGV